VDEYSTSHRDDFIRWVHFQLLLPGQQRRQSSTNVRSRISRGVIGALPVAAWKV